jgi:hypothetical protein
LDSPIPDSVNGELSMRPAITPFVARADSNNPYFLRFLFGLFIVLVFTRLLMTPNLVDMIENYTTEQGSLVEKIHPANYGFAIVALATLLTTRIELAPWELRIVRGFIALTIVIAAICTLMLLMGGSGSAGYLIDTYVFACVTAVTMFAFPPSWRRSLGNAVLVFLVVSSFIAICEFVTKHRVMPYAGEELTFRPTGLAGHPLVLGLCNAVAIGFVMETRWRQSFKFIAASILLVGAFAAGARLASIVAAVLTLLIVLLADFPSISRHRRVQAKALIVIAAILAVPVMIGGLIAAGFTDRFEHGLFDESAMARIEIYRVFDLVNWSQILFGADIEAVRTLAKERFDLDFIESSLVVFIFQFGLIGTIVFLFFLGRLFFALIAGAQRNVVLASIAFVIIALGNNGLSAKSSMIVMLFVLVIAFRDPPPRVQAVRGRPRGGR